MKQSLIGIQFMEGYIMQKNKLINKSTDSIKKKIITILFYFELND